MITSRMFKFCQKMLYKRVGVNIVNIYTKKIVYHRYHKLVFYNTFTLRWINKNTHTYCPRDSSSRRWNYGKKKVFLKKSDLKRNFYLNSNTLNVYICVVTYSSWIVMISILLLSNKFKKKNGVSICN